MASVPDCNSPAANGSLANPTLMCRQVETAPHHRSAGDLAGAGLFFGVILALVYWAYRKLRTPRVPEARVVDRSDHEP